MTFEIFVPEWGAVVALALAFGVIYLWFVALVKEFF